MSKISKVPKVTRMVGVLVTILVTVTVCPIAANLRSTEVPTLTKIAGVLITIRELSLFLMLQIPEMPTITRMAHVAHPHHRGRERSE